MRLVILTCCFATSLYAQATPTPVWTLSSRPTLEIADEANTQTQFNGVAGVLRMPRGEIVVANGLSQELRVFSAAGAHLRTLSQLGTAPGELRSLNRLWRAGDTIIVGELLPGETNLHLYSTTGFIGRRPVGRANAGSLTPVDRFVDGRVLVRAARRSGRAGIVNGTPFRDSAMIGVVSLSDLMPSWIATLSSEMILIPGFSGGRGRMPAVVPYVFGKTEAYAVSGDRLWIGDSETGRIEQYDSRGRKLGQFFAPIPQRPIDSLVIRGQRQAAINDAMNWNDRARLDASYTAPLPAFAPRFQRFLPGPGGEMWVELFSERREVPATYLVLDVTGKAKGRLTMPRATTLFEVGTDYVMAVRRDDDGLEHVVQYSLTRR